MNAKSSEYTVNLKKSNINICTLFNFSREEDRLYIFPYICLKYTWKNTWDRYSDFFFFFFLVGWMETRKNWKAIEARWHFMYLSFQVNEKYKLIVYSKLGFTGGSDCKESACNAGDPRLIPALGWSPGEGNGNPLQYSCLENSMDREAWQATVQGLPRVGHN